MTKMNHKMLTLLLNYRGMSKTEAARRCGYTASYMTSLANGRTPISKGCVLRLIAGLDITDEELGYISNYGRG